MYERNDRVLSLSLACYGNCNYRNGTTSCLSAKSAIQCSDACELHVFYAKRIQNAHKSAIHIRGWACVCTSAASHKSPLKPYLADLARDIVLGRPRTHFNEYSLAKQPRHNAKAILKNYELTVNWDTYYATNYPFCKNVLKTVKLWTEFLNKFFLILSVHFIAMLKSETNR